MNNPVCETVSVREAAARIGCSYVLALQLIKDRRLRARWLGNKYRVPVAAVAEFLAGSDVHDELGGRDA